MGRPRLRGRAYVVALPKAALFLAPHLSYTTFSCLLKANTKNEMLIDAIFKVYYIFGVMCIVSW